MVRAADLLCMAGVCVRDREVVPRQRRGREPERSRAREVESPRSRARESKISTFLDTSGAPPRTPALDPAKIIAFGPKQGKYARTSLERGVAR